MSVLSMGIDRFVPLSLSFLFLFLFFSVTVFIFYTIKGRALCIGLREYYVYYLGWLGLTRVVKDDGPVAQK